MIPTKVFVVLEGQGGPHTNEAFLIRVCGHREDAEKTAEGHPARWVETWRVT